MSAARPGFLERVGLHRPELRAWALYDWANSAFFTTVVAGVFPVFYGRYAAAELGTEEPSRRLGLALSLGALLTAVAAPLLGALADHSRGKKKLLAAFAGLGVASCGAMYLIGGGDWRLGFVLIALGNMGAYGANVAYDSLLPHVAKEGELDRVSTAGYAVGYLGGGLLLLLNVGWLLKPGWFGLPDDEELVMRLCFVSVAVWWALFTIPLLLRVSEPPLPAGARMVRGAALVRESAARVRATFRELGRFREAMLLLIAALLFGEGAGTVYKLATAYATDLELDGKTLIVAILLTQFVGVPSAIGFGRVAQRFGARRALYAGLAVYVGVCTYGYFLSSEAGFFCLAVVVGLVQGGVQALGRSLFASIVPAHRTTEFFGFFALGSKVAGLFGPLSYSLVGEWTGSNRIAILSIIPFFVLGGLLLSRVDFAEGRRAAREAEERERALRG